MRAAIYVRVSTQDQSCELQLTDLREYCAARGWKIAEVYEDHGATGTNTKRPRLQAMLTDARRRKFDVVIVWKLDRFARSLKDLVLMMQELSELGVQMVSLRDQLDLTTSAGRLMVHMLGAFAEFEASLIRERVRSGIRNARAKGKRLGRPKTRNDERIAQLRRQGHSYRQIATALGTSIGAVQRSVCECDKRSG